MDKLEQFVKFNELYAVYGALLTSTQQQIMEAYYFYNLSLGEIAENLGISKQGVSDALKVATAKLEDYENKVGYLSYQQKVEKTLLQLEKEPLSEHSQKLLSKLREDK